MTKGIRSAARTVAATTVSLLIVSAFLERANANQGGEAPGEVVPVLTKAERGRVGDGKVGEAGHRELLEWRADGSRIVAGIA